MICDYNNLWSSYLTFKDKAAIEHLMDYLKKLEERGLRNLYVFCPRELADARVHIIAHGFILECIRKIGGIDNIVKAQDEPFLTRITESLVPKETMMT